MTRDYPSDAYKNPVAEGNGLQQPQISSESTALVEQTEVLMKLVSQLEERLHPIMRQLSSPPVELPDDSAKRLPLAPHAEFLRTRNAILNNAVGVLRSILNRIEI